MVRDKLLKENEAKFSIFHACIHSVYSGYYGKFQLLLWATTSGGGRRSHSLCRFVLERPSGYLLNATSGMINAGIALYIVQHHL